MASDGQVTLLQVVAESYESHLVKRRHVNAFLCCHRINIHWFFFVTLCCAIRSSLILVATLCRLWRRALNAKVSPNCMFVGAILHFRFP